MKDFISRHLAILTLALFVLAIGIYSTPPLVWWFGLSAMFLLVILTEEWMMKRQRERREKAETDPEWSEYVRLRKKFKDVEL